MQHELGSLSASALASVAELLPLLYRVLRADGGPLVMYLWRRG